jgi:hypothetical protein
MIIEDQRFVHEDLERLEQAISDRLAEDPRNVGIFPEYHPLFWLTRNAKRSRTD